MSASPLLALRWLNTSEVIDSAPGADMSCLKKWPAIGAIGSVTLLRSSLLALFCSIRCPGKLILETYDLARALRDASVPVISGFHTPMEKECLDLLLRGNQPVVMCPARSIEGIRPPVAAFPLQAKGPPADRQAGRGTQPLRSGPGNRSVRRLCSRGRQNRAALPRPDRGEKASLHIRRSQPCTADRDRLHVNHDIRSH